jgi:hypothetical protein
MRYLAILSALAAATRAAYTGDVVQYWVDQSILLTNGTVVRGLPSPPSAWFPAIVQGAIYSAALESRGKSRDFQQLAVSHAAHDALAWTFHGVSLGGTIDNALRRVLADISISTSSKDYDRAVKIGRKAAEKVARARTGDKIDHFVDYKHGPAEPGRYQPTPGGRPLPDTPQARFIRPFGGIKDLTKFRAPEPPEATAEGYEKYVVELIELGGRESTNRTEDETHIAYFWLESSVAGWNRFAHAVVGNSLASNVIASAKFYAQLNYALANAAIGSWDSKYHWDHWRPVTAIQREGIWLESGRDIHDPDWLPLLNTPSHQDYVSTHAAFGAAGAAVIKYINGGDEVDTWFSSNVTIDNQGVLTRHFTSIDDAAYENARSRIYGGIHFTYAGDEGLALGTAIAEETLDLFDEHWDDF